VRCCGILTGAARSCHQFRSPFSFLKAYIFLPNGLFSGWPWPRSPANARHSGAHLGHTRLGPSLSYRLTASLSRISRSLMNANQKRHGFLFPVLHSHRHRLPSQIFRALSYSSLARPSHLPHWFPIPISSIPQR
jgi:hypothetical protein